eukprot:COSAG03_NODE_16775_length_392_cov_1.508532_1_plen_77_part_10
MENIYVCIYVRIYVSMCHNNVLSGEVTPLSPPATRPTTPHPAYPLTGTCTVHFFNSANGMGMNAYIIYTQSLHQNVH